MNIIHLCIPEPRSANVFLIFCSSYINHSIKYSAKSLSIVANILEKTTHSDNNNKQYTLRKDIPSLTYVYNPYLSSSYTTQHLFASRILLPKPYLSFPTHQPLPPIIIPSLIYPSPKAKNNTQLTSYYDSKALPFNLFLYRE